MTVSLVASGTIVYSTTATLTPSYPTAAIGDRTILIVQWKPSVGTNANGPATPSGWTQIYKRIPDITLETSGGYTAIPGVDTGNMGWAAYFRDHPTIMPEGSITVTMTGSNIAASAIYTIRKTGSSWEVPVYNEKWQTTTPGTTLAVGLANFSNFGLKSGDLILCGMAIPTDVTTPAQFSAQSFSHSGTTFGTFAESHEYDTASGSDMGGWVGSIPVTAGSDTAQTLTITTTIAGTRTNVRGPVWALRFRDITTPVFTGPTVQATATSTGAAGSVSITQAQIAGVVAGDVLAVFVSAVDPTNTDAYISGPGDWELVTQIGSGAGTYISESRMFVRPWVSGDGTYTFTDGSGTAPYMTAECLVIRGANVADIVGAPNVTFGTGTTVTGASVTAIAQSLLLVGALQYGTATAYSSVGTMTSRATTSEANGPSRTVIASENIVPAGATGTRTLTAGAAGAGWSTISVAINPYAPPAGVTDYWGAAA